MPGRLLIIRPLAALAVAGLLGLAGCRVDTHADGNRKNNNVDIATPFGGLSVKTDGNAVSGNTGMTVYPGARIAEKDHDGDNGAADVNLSLGKFSLRVKAISYLTDDPSAKVLAFYKKDLTRYGTVIQCQDKHPVGLPARTQDGLTCDDDSHDHGTSNHSVSGDLELKTGSKQHQHIVAIDPRGSGTKIGLVALDLPGHMSLSSDNDDDSEDHKQ